MLELVILRYLPNHFKVEFEQKIKPAYVGIYDQMRTRIDNVFKTSSRVIRNKHRSCTVLINVTKNLDYSRESDYVKEKMFVSQL